MNVHDIVFSAGSLVMISLTVSSLLNPLTAVPRRNSALNGIVLYIFATNFLFLGIPLAGVLNSIHAGLWILMAWYRPVWQRTVGDLFQTLDLVPVQVHPDKMPWPAGYRFRAPSPEDPTRLYYRPFSTPKPEAGDSGLAPREGVDI